MWKRFKQRLTWSNIGISFFALLSTFAVIPYEQGWFSTLVPPKIKPWLAPTCAGAAFVLRILRPNKDSSSTPTVVNYYGDVTIHNKT